jgi:ATP-dependent DNA helicase PIF1
LNHDVALDEPVDDDVSDPEAMVDEHTLPVPLGCENELMAQIERCGLYSLRNRNSVTDNNTDSGRATLFQEDDRATLNMHSSLMSRLRSNKRPATRIASTQQEEESRYGARRRTGEQPALTMEQLEDEIEIVNVPWRNDMKSSPAEELENIIFEWGLKENPEQERAVRIVGEHFVYGREDQLLMYVGGIGGSGKSYVVRAIVEMFKRCGASEKILLSAPTGCAAVLIGGYTIHALTFLPKSKHSPKQMDLETVWRLVKYLVIDEISMIDSALLSQISHRIGIGRAFDEKAQGLPFGGINVMFTGDMGQLRPVKAKSLFSYELIKKTVT